MSTIYIPGVETLQPFEGGYAPTWLPDEDGSLARNAAIAARAFHCEPVPFNEAMLRDIEWQRRCDEMTIEALSAEREDARDSAVEHAARIQADLEALGASGSVGLVSVLSTHRDRSKDQQRTPRVPFRVSAERTAAVQAAGAFVSGGDEVRMAKLRRAVGFAARAHGATRPAHRPDEVRMVTLTYRDGVAWDKVHMERYTHRVREWHKAAGVPFRYVWIAEIQDGKRRADGKGRGVIHYHVAIWVPIGTPHMPMSDKQGWWPHGMTKTELAKGAVQYLLHYLKKGNSKHFKEFPHGARTYGVGGLDHSLRRARRWLGLPSFVQGNSSSFDDWKRSEKGTGGGWIDPTGQHWPSEFRRINVAGCTALQRVHRHERAIEANGPFSWLTDRALAIHREASS